MPKKSMKLGRKGFMGFSTLLVTPKTGSDGVKQPAYFRAPSVFRKSENVRKVMEAIASLKGKEYKDEITVNDKLYELVKSITGKDPEKYGFSRGEKIRGRKVAKLGFILAIGKYKGVSGAAEALEGLFK